MSFTDLSQIHWQEINKMFLKTHFRIDGIAVAFIVRSVTEQRLSTTCFRGTDKKLAGNFMAFRSHNDLFDTSDSTWLPGFVADIKETLERGDSTASYSFDKGTDVGWSGTASISRYQPDDMEIFEPNRRSQAFRIKTSRCDLLAPLTSLVTMVYEVRIEGSIIGVIIHSIYPGEDIGELRGDVSKREGIVFFDWNHPGEPL